MVDDDAKKVLREYDDDVLRAHYQKEIMVTNNPDQLVVFPNGGKIKLSVLSSRLKRKARVGFLLPLFLSIFGAIVGGVGAWYGVWGYQIAKHTEDNAVMTQKVHQQLGRFMREGQAIVDDLENSKPYGGIKQRANDWNRALTTYILDHLGDAYENRLYNEAGAQAATPFFLTGNKAHAECWYYLHLRLVKLEQFSEEQFAPPLKSAAPGQTIADICPKE